MKYIKVVFFTFLAVFFADQILPEILVTQTKIPHLGADLPFALIMSLLNASIYPALRTFKGSSPVLQTAVIAAIINFAAYGIVNLFHSGIHVETIVGYLTVATVVTICSFVANYLSMREDLRLPPEQNIPPPGDYPQL